jgi:hypothetical protein
MIAFLRFQAIIALVVMSASMVKADMVDLISESPWAEECSYPGVREATRWVVVARNEWCEEFVGDFGRVHSVCRPLSWEPLRANRLRVVFLDDGTEWFVELTTANRLSVFSEQHGRYRQETVLGRARVNETIETLHLECR